MTLPNFFIVGAQKAGTTSLYHYLTQHPQVYMSPVKEPSFFNHVLTLDGEIVDGTFGGPHRHKTPKYFSISEYRTLFRGVRDEQVIGEASPSYIYVPGTAERINRYLPEAKVVVLLRDPADRAYSAFLHAIRLGREPVTDFARALREEEDRISANWHYTFHYRARGFYYAQLKRYYEAFGPERVAVWLYEDLRENPIEVAQGVFRFLGVNDEFVPDTSSKHNPSGVPKGGVSRASITLMDTLASIFLERFTPNSKIFPVLSRIRRHVQSSVVARPLPIDPEVRADLIRGYEEDILKLQRLIARDLSAWLTVEGESSRPGAQTAGVPD